jgi:hypothetical protein
LYNVLQAYGGEAMKKQSVFEWHKRFKEGRERVDDDDEEVQALAEPMKMLKKCGI